MKFWNLLAFVEDEQLIEAAQFCEEIGFDAVGVSDHLFIPEELKSPYPGSKAAGDKPFFTVEQKWSFPDPWVALGMIAATTRRVRLFQSIFVLPPRDPIDIAKSTGTLATLAPGRLLFCPAVGWMKEECDVYGVDFHTRGRRSDEMIEVLRKLWSGEIVEHTGEFFSFPRLRSLPAPGNIPIIASGPSELVMRRAARLCDGWMDAATSMVTLRERLATLRKLREDVGRARSPFEVVIIPTAQLASGLSLDDIRMAEDQGVTAVQILPAFFYLNRRSSLDDKKQLWERLAEKILRHF